MNSWGRLEEVIKTTGLSINAFANSIGLKRAENLYRIKKGKNSISKELSETITTKYCNISKSWLLTGEGDMYLSPYKNTNKTNKEDELSSIKRIPFYDSLFSNIKEIKGEKLPKPLYYIEIPSLSNCDFASLFMGDSMSPEIPSGSIVALKEIDIRLILPGEMYFIVTKEYSTIKYIRIIENNDSSFRLVPANNAYDEMVLNKDLICRLFLVKGVISTKIM